MTVNKISVLIPTLNRAAYLDRLLRSLDRQTLGEEIDCIISDNNSSDHTKEIVDKWEAAESLNIIYLKNKRTIPPIENWRILVEKSNTEYSKFVFDDDWLEDTCLEQMLYLIEDKKVETVISNYNISLEDSNSELVELKKDYLDKQSRYLKKEDVIDFFLLKGRVINVSPTGALFRTKTMKEAFYFSIKEGSVCSEKGIGNDLIMNFYTLFKEQNVFYTSESLVNVSAHPESITVKTDDRVTYYCYLKSLNKLLKRFSTKLNIKQRRALLSRLLIYRIRSFYKPKFDAGI